MDLKTFRELSKKYNLIPVYEIITADLLTPVLAYLKIRQKNSQSFLLESVEGSTNMARYSFIGKNPERIFSNKANKIFLDSQAGLKEFDGSIFNFIRNELEKYKQPKLEELPDFTGGIVGYLGYENIALIEPKIKITKNDLENFDSMFGFYKCILAFDHYKHQIIIICNVVIENHSDSDDLYYGAKRNIERLKHQLKKPFSYKSDFKIIESDSESFNKENFYKTVLKAKQNIINGDIFQIVISEKFSAKFSGDLLNVYRALRIINPSPYMYYLEFKNNFKIIGTSPEDLLKVKDHTAQLLPIAGTRRRGRTKEEDLKLEQELCNDPKEIAEHTMLLDLGRNDLGKVCQFGSVKVKEKMKVQRYSHVMHLVSSVVGKISKDKDSIDALTACFPAGTVTGAPKIKAIQLIDEYENYRRNVYAGAVGYFDFSGNLDMCIAIRTLFANSNYVFWQAGAGIVADSKPELEAKEILNKSAVLVNALKIAEVIDEDSSNR